MKKIWLILLLVIGCCLLVTACDGNDLVQAEITTAKSGSIDVTVYPARENKAPEATLTPLVTTNDAGITDDGNGLYRVSVTKSGEGEVTLSQIKAEAGATIRIAAIPETDWKLTGISVNGADLAEDTFSFVMPEQDTTVNVTFADMRHAVVVGDHIVADWGELRTDFYLSTAYTIVEGTPYSFSVDYEEEGHYYEDKDVICRSFDGTEIAVTKIGAGRYQFVAPDNDCDLTVKTHEYRHFDGVRVYTASYDWGIYSEQNYTDSFTIGITVDGRPYTFGETAKDDAEVTVTLSADAPFTVLNIFNDTNSLSVEKDPTADRYTFPLNFSAQELRIKIQWAQEMRSITINESEHGAISASSHAAPDAQVTVTVTPDENYSLATLQYSYEQDVWQDIQEQDGAYVFTMPDADVTIRATFDGSQPPETNGGFRVRVVPAAYDGEEYALTTVVIQLGWAVNGGIVEIVELTDDLSFHVEAGQQIELSVWLNEEQEYILFAITFRDEDVTSINDGFYGVGQFEIGEEDVNGCVYIVFGHN